MDFIEEFIDFLIGASEQTRQHVDAVIKEAIACSVKVVLALPKKYFAKLHSMNKIKDLIFYRQYFFKKICFHVNAIF